MDGTDSVRGLDWQAAGSCVGVEDPDIFFPDRSDVPTDALAICGGCPVQLACRRHALTQPERFGVWGGLTEVERDRLLRASQARLQAGRPSAWVGLRRRRLGA